MANEIQVIYKKNQDINSKKSNYKGFKQETTVLPKGYVSGKTSIPLECDIVFEQDVAVQLRDGTTIYTDILRPNTEEKVPAIIAWSPYGKNGSGAYFLTMFPGKLGVTGVSELMKWEGPDPAYWCKYGYAVCHPDTRGAFMSEGDTYFWGTQDARDGADYVEWVAKQDWCSGKVGMSGNSWLAIAQWYIAAEQPEHLTCIAPWEGHSNLYKDDVAKGGISDPGFNDTVVTFLYGNGQIEDLGAMIQKYPLINNEFWQDRIPDLSKVKVPAYVVGSYSNVVHTPGTFRAWEGIASEEKWFRIHDEMEWKDYYNPESMDDLRRFFDHYLKGIDNGWENTPKIRASVLDPGGKDVHGIPLESFPPADAVKTKWYLHGDRTLSAEAAVTASEISYISDNDKDKVQFLYEFDRDETLFGYGFLKLWIETQDADDTAVYVRVEKIGKDGKVKKSHVVRPDNKALELLYKVIPMNSAHYGGPNGRLRASRRHVDEDRTTDREIYHTFDRVEKLEKGVPVPLLINLSPVGMIYHRGEKLCLTIAGYDLVGSAIPGVKLTKPGNKGTVTVKTGSSYDSYLQFHVMEQ